MSEIKPESYNNTPGFAQNLSQVEIDTNTIAPLSTSKGIYPRYGVLAYNVNSNGISDIVPDRYSVSPGYAQNLTYVEVDTSVIPALSGNHGVYPRYAQLVYLLNPGGGSGGGDVTSVNGKTGDVVLSASDLDAYTKEETNTTINNIAAVLSADNTFTGSNTFTNTVQVNTLFTENGKVAIGESFNGIYLSDNTAGLSFEGGNTIKGLDVLDTHTGAGTGTLSDSDNKVASSKLVAEELTKKANLSAVESLSASVWDKNDPNSIISKIYEKWYTTEVLSGVETLLNTNEDGTSTTITVKDNAITIYKVLLIWRQVDQLSNINLSYKSINLVVTKSNGTLTCSDASIQTYNVINTDGLSSIDVQQINENLQIAVTSNGDATCYICPNQRVINL